MAEIDALKYFRLEAQEHLEGLNTGLLHLEANPDDKSTLQTLFRLAHTLKGSARMVALNDVGMVAHKLEDVLGTLRDEDGASASETVISAMLDAIHIIERMMTELDQEGDTDTGPVIERLQCAVEVARQGEVCALSDSPETDGANGADRADERTGRDRTDPAEPEGASGRATDGSIDRSIGNPTGSPTGDPTNKPTGRALPEDVYGPNPADAGVVRVQLTKVDKLANLAGELVINKIRLADQNASLSALSHDIMRAIRSLNEIQEWARSKDVQQLLAGTDQGKALGSILARTRTVALREGLKGLVSDAKSQVAQLDNVVSSLHEKVMDLRMLPASTLTTPLKLVLREAALYLKKPARLEVTGEGIEIDKALLEGIREPLAHLIRNAVDHGLESTDVRTAKGKPGEGRIQLRFERHGATLTVTVSDDGAGIDLERVRKESIKRGMLDPGGSEIPQPDELFRSLSSPGFTTASEVTEISGRGVGLDVVASAVKRLKGSIEFTSAPDQGTTVHMRFPVNLSTLDGFLFQSGLRAFAVPLEAVVQVRRLASMQTDTCARKPVLNVGGRSIPYVSMQALLGTPVGEHREAVILNWAGDRIAVGVDRVIGVRTMLIKPLLEHVGHLPWVSGITLLSSGRPAVVLDVEHLFKQASGGERPPVSEPGGPHGLRQGPPHDHQTKTVLVVDDSLSARMMEKAMLESAGFHVVLASDGEEGLGKLARGGIDLVVSDVEMPRMTGLELVGHVRAQAESQNLPIIIISSLATEKDRRRGLDAGADAYLVKGELTQGALLAVVTRLLGETHE